MTGTCGETGWPDVSGMQVQAGRIPGEEARVVLARDLVEACRYVVCMSYAYPASPEGGGKARWPTVLELTDPEPRLWGETGPLPGNPFDADGTGDNVVDATGREPGDIVGRGGGWAYNPTNGALWLNTSTSGIRENLW